MSAKYSLRVVKNRQKRKEKRAWSSQTLREWITLCLAAIGTVVATAGVFTWISESSDRQWARELRHATLYESALSTLNLSDGSIIPNNSVQRAIWLMHFLDEPVEISGKKVDLTGLILPCGSYRITGDEVIFNTTSVYKAYVYIKSPKVSIERSQFRHSELIARSSSRTDTKQPPMVFHFSRALNSIFMFEDGADIMFSTFEKSKVRSWLGEILWNDTSIYLPIALPSYENTMWQENEDMEYSNFFDPKEVEKVRAKAELSPLKSEQTDSYMFEQRYSFTYIDSELPEVSDEWSDYCSKEGDSLLCNRLEPTYYALKSLPDSAIPCSDKNDYANFDPAKHGDKPAFKKTMHRP